jgi:hypothetical protein
MDVQEARSRRYLADLFAGPFPGHAIVVSREGAPPPGDPGDYCTSSRPVRDWIPWAVDKYERDAEWHRALGDDGVPFVSMTTHTGVFAAAFGCPIHPFEGSLAAARPIVCTAEEADRLPEPGLDARSLERVFELAEGVRERLGPQVPIGVPDIQSPFDIAALVWNKEEMYVALMENPGAVCRLVDKCERLLTSFLLEYRRRFPAWNPVHCPDTWAPSELGCSLSEDEAGCMSVRMFEAYCLPGLVRLSETFGGLFVHCCATADHQYASFRKIPNLRSMNRVFQAPGPRPAIEAFSGHAVLTMAWIPEDDINRMIDMALPNTRYLFNVSASSLDDARALLDRLRARCARHAFREDGR